MKINRISLPLLLFTILSFLFITPSIYASEGSTLERIKEKGTLTIGLSADYPPYEFHATVNGKDTVVGADVSMGEKIAKDLGVTLKIEELGFDALLGSLQTGKVDLVISGMAPTPEREKEVAFSNPYLQLDQKIIIRKEDQEKFKTTSDFSDSKVGAQKQSTQEALAQKELTGAKIVSLQKVTDMIMTLQNKKVDAIVLEGPVAEAYVSQNSELTLADVKFKEGDSELAIALKKEQPELLTAVNKSIKQIDDQELMPSYKEAAAKLMLADDTSFFEKYGGNFAKGTFYTIFLALVGVLSGAVLGTILAFMKLSKTKLIKTFAVIYIEYVRGTPLLVQIFLVYFGTTSLGLDVNALTAGCIALALNSAAYVAEIIRAGINAVDKGQLEAARSLGMTEYEGMKLIVLPQAIKNILPALANEFVTVIKESSVVSVIGVSDLMFQAGVVQGASFKPFLPIVIVSIIYFILTFSLSRLIGVAERRMEN
ncbi:ABC transporter substrate-binding protein/permease [Vagococcus fessus]|uniref:ABC transporter permease n=1 Tax=Vagococcus fessus TaxID=120370 RepID=A0A430AD81_9ENTE|nr:ABC transporter substrate-binding protein/permease [Vagococcus fessus]RSU05169.1 ABC transporter permease [Vagococcus fessus]